MLPVFTTTQVKDGIDSGDLMLDLSDYIKKKDAATKTDINTLTAALAGKLDATPQHKHQIDDVNQLQNALDGKLDKGERYSHSMILSDVESISYLEAPEVGSLKLGDYTFYVDSASGDLMITRNDVLIGSYAAAAGKWRNDDLAALNKRVNNNEIVLENHYEALTAVCGATLKNITDIADNGTKINTLEAALNDYVAKTDAVLKNHYDAILLLCQKHGMVDGDGDGASNISPA